MTETVIPEINELIGPTKGFLTPQEYEKDVAEKTEKEHRNEFQKLINEYRVVLRDKPPEGSPPSTVVTTLHRSVARE